MRTERIRMSRHAETPKAIDCVLKRWPAFIRFLDKPAPAKPGGRIAY